MQVDDRIRDELRRLGEKVEADPEEALVRVLRQGRRHRAARRIIAASVVGALVTLAVLLGPRLADLLPAPTVGPGGDPGSAPAVGPPRVVARGTAPGYEWSLVAFQAQGRLCATLVSEIERVDQYGTVTLRPGYGTGCESVDTKDPIRFFLIEVEIPGPPRETAAFGWVHEQVSSLMLEMAGGEQRPVPLLSLPPGVDYPARAFVVAPLLRGADSLVARDDRGTEMGRDEIPGGAEFLGCPEAVADLPNYC
jgi:hypothetical protein